MKKIFMVITAIMLFWTVKNYSQSVQIKNAWVRPVVEGSNSALYFVAENKWEKPDTLISAISKSAEIVEIHETYKKDNDKMGMRPAGKIAIEPKSKVEFKPGGMHIMLINVTGDFKIGDSFETELQFKHAGKIKVKAKVQDSSSMHSMMH